MEFSGERARRYSSLDWATRSDYIDAVVAAGRFCSTDVDLVDIRIGKEFKDIHDTVILLILSDMGAVLTVQRAAIEIYLGRTPTLLHADEFHRNP